MKNEKLIKYIAAALLILLALVCALSVSKKMSDPATYGNTIQYLDEKKETVMHLTAASTAASAAITLLPGDTATPIAEKLADLSSYFLIVISAIYLEKYLVTIVGYAAFTFIIPIALALFAVRLFWKSEGIMTVAKKLLALGVAMAMIIPAGVKVSNMIEEIYGDSMQETIVAAESVTEEVQAEENEEETDQGWFSGIVSDIKDAVTVNTEKFENVLNRYIEALAVLIVTSCLIPILVLLFFCWIIKTVVGVDIKLPQRHVIGNS